ncbi:hypothetical protein [Brevibacillus porteri]|nr:hypothetical protein [Brevibacillus porteri]MED1801984.1 hypothetical protein [Brevibacillus porteri]MED2132545.1 hypothetical protein [Brevibacillus porteri]MED2745425.1 hypothetical protein [Brevibacillus porteri]MED2814298.1 hypothetical protein [Brevibacillus porteri]MED2892547.1 hypothetical protein [Brevibacillus porteri]
MRKWVCMTVVAGLIVGGCSPDTSVSTDSKQQPVAEQKQEAGNSGGDQKQEKQTATVRQITLDEQFLQLLAKNEISGFDIHIGMKRDEVSALYGKVTKQDYWDGGRYEVFEKLESALIYFDGQDRVYGIDLAGLHLNETNLDTIRKNLGAPVSEDKSMADEDYVMFFEAGDNSVFISAKDEQSPADKIRIINKKMIEESPQKE